MWRKLQFSLAELSRTNLAKFIQFLTTARLTGNRGWRTSVWSELCWWQVSQWRRSGVSRSCIIVIILRSRSVWWTHGLPQVSRVSLRVLREGSEVSGCQRVLHHHRLPITVPQEQGKPGVNISFSHIDKHLFYMKRKVFIFRFLLLLLQSTLSATSYLRDVFLFENTFYFNYSPLASL